MTVGEGAAVGQSYGGVVVDLLGGERGGQPEVQVERLGRPPEGDVSQLFFPPAVSLTLLTFATYLGVFKPWGRIAGRSPSS